MSGQNTYDSSPESSRGGVIIPRLTMGFVFLASTISLAAIASQWLENRQLRQKMIAMQESVAQAALRQEEQVRADREQSAAYIAKVNAWITSMNERLSQMNAVAVRAEHNVEQARWARDAQSIVSVYAAGLAAGTAWQGASRDELVADVRRGRAPTAGPFEGRVFRVPGSEKPVAAEVYLYIGLEPEGTLFYDKTGGQNPGPGPKSMPAAASASRSMMIPPMPLLPEG